MRAVDGSISACTILRERLSARPDLPGSVQVEHALVTLTDVPDGKYDLILDSYVSCHLLSDEERLRYLESLTQRLRPGGALYTACLGAKDSYYTRHLVSSASDLPIATDPLNGVSKLLQTGPHFGERLRQLFPVVASTEESFLDRVADRVYRREVLAAVLRRPV